MKMAQNRLIFCLTRADSRLVSLPIKHQVSPSLVIPFRSKGKATKQKKAKKDLRAQEMKDYAKRMEMQKLMQNAALKAAKKGEPLDIEMLNPARKRAPPTLTYEEKDRRFLLSKEWARFQMSKEIQQRQLLGGMVKSRAKALNELKKVAPMLYCKALELNPDLFPFECKGPTETPPMADYVPPDPED